MWLPCHLNKIVLPEREKSAEKKRMADRLNNWAIDTDCAAMQFERKLVRKWAIAAVGRERKGLMHKQDSTEGDWLV